MHSGTNKIVGLATPLRACMPASFKIPSILCEAEPIYGRLTEH